MQVDAIVVGQGLAGTALAWRLLEAGLTVRIIDPARKATCSQIAAGLITPITGKKHVLSWRWDEFWKAAVPCYQRLEARLQTSFLHQQAHLKLFRDETAIKLWQAAIQKRPELKNYFRTCSLITEDQQPWNACDAVWLEPAGQLQTENYLSASNASFRGQQIFIEDSLNESDIELNHQGVYLSKHSLQANYCFFCRGIVDQQLSWFSNFRFLPAKGEILKITTNLPAHQIVHSDVWLAADQQGQFRIGATYETQVLNNIPTAKGRAELQQRLQTSFKEAYQITGHQAAVRPATFDQKPAIGFHPDFPQLGILNGLGSKGALQSPLLASQLVQAITDNQPIDPAWDWRRSWLA